MQIDVLEGDRLSGDEEASARLRPDRVPIDMNGRFYDGLVAAEHGRIEGRLFEDWRHLCDAEILRELALQ